MKQDSESYNEDAISNLQGVLEVFGEYSGFVGFRNSVRKQRLIQ